MARRKSRIFSERELQVMKAVWKLGEASVHDVRAELGGERAGAYTSIATMLKFLEKKGALKHAQDGRTYYYVPAVSEERTKEKTAQYVLKHFFNGDLVALVAVLTKVAKPSPAERRAVSAALDGKRK